jgi:uncharacterized protein (DUF1330 family)
LPVEGPALPGTNVSTEPRAYFVSRVSSGDPPRSAREGSALARACEVHQGRVLMLMQPVRAVIGTQNDGRLTLVEFPAAARAQGLLEDPDYRRVMGELGGDAWTAEGIQPPPPSSPAAPGRRAYVVTFSRVVNADRLKVYRELIAPMISAYGGSYLAQFGGARCLTGPPDGNTLSILEFHSMRHLQAGLDSDNFRDMMRMGVGIAYQHFWVAEGVEHPG